MIDALQMFLIVLATVDTIAILSAAVIERRDFDKIVAWTIIILILPFIGALGYFIIGQRVSLYGQYRRKREKETEAESFFKADTGIGLDDVIGVSTSYNNSVSLFTDGRSLFSAMKEDVDSAVLSIRMEYYLVIDDELGAGMIDSLCKKAEEGLDVMLIGDGFGFRKLSDFSLRKMKDSGVRFTYINKPSFHSLNPRTNNCDHRKMIVIDGRVTYCSGMNVTNDYVGSGHLGFWRDSAVRVEGDISEHAKRRFMMTWAYAADTDIPEIDGGPDEFEGKEKVSLVYGGPDLRPNPIIEQYIRMMDSAKKEVFIETPYFTNVELIKAVRRTAERGIDVKMIIPGKPDHWFTFWNNCRSAKKAVRSGVMIHLYDRGFMHSKIVAVDGSVSSVGSGNFDDRTAYYNFDANMMFHSEKVTKEIVHMFEEDLQHCRPFDPKEYRGLIPTIKTFICNVVRPLA